MGRPQEIIDLFVLQKLFDNFRDVFLIIILHKLVRDTKIFESIWFHMIFEDVQVNKTAIMPGILTNGPTR